MNPTTPDGHYFVVIRQLWRCSNPSLSKDVRQRLVNDLMAARREGKGSESLWRSWAAEVGQGARSNGQGSARGAWAGLVERWKP
jgi:hypothetical protein